MKRRRINLSVDPKTYDELQRIRMEHNFKNLCELVEAVVHIMLDSFSDPEKNQFNLPEDDAAYISDMFKEFSNVEKTPDGTIPVRHNKKIYGKD